MDSLLLSVLLIHLSLFPQQPPIYQRVPEKRKGPQFFANHGPQRNGQKYLYGQHPAMLAADFQSC